MTQEFSDVVLTVDARNVNVKRYIVFGIAKCMDNKTIYQRLWWSLNVSVVRQTLASFNVNICFVACNVLHVF